MNRITSSYNRVKRYQSLRMIAVIFTLVGALSLAIGTLLLVFGIFTLLTGQMSVTSQAASPFPPGQRVIPISLSLGGSISVLW